VRLALGFSDTCARARAGSPSSRARRSPSCLPPHGSLSLEGGAPEGASGGAPRGSPLLPQGAAAEGAHEGRAHEERRLVEHL